MDLIEPDAPSRREGPQGEPRTPPHRVITGEVVAEYVERARVKLGKDVISGKEYAALAREAADHGRYYLAAVYYMIADFESMPHAESDEYHREARNMLGRIDDES